MEQIINTLSSVLFMGIFLITGGMSAGFFLNARRDKAPAIYIAFGAVCGIISYMSGTLLLDSWLA